MVNGEKVSGTEAGTYFEIKRAWKKGDEILLDLGMEPFLVESNPLVEENRNMVAVQRGPVVYCLESTGLPEGVQMADVLIPVGGKLDPVPMQIGKHRFLGLESELKLKQSGNWANELYKRLEDEDLGSARIRLVPYYAWGNRGEGEMTVWIPALWH